jgi:hypothetical protein
MSPNKFQPALLGGLVLGVLSSLPVVNVANCCCIWLVTGGVLAAWVMQQNHPAPIQLADGAMAGLLAGVFGAIVWLVLYVPMHMLTGDMQARMVERVLQNAGDLPANVRDALENAQSGGSLAASIVIGFLFMLVAGAIFSTLGGLLGAALFKKGQPPPPPPPPSYVPPSAPPPLTPPPAL